MKIRIWQRLASFLLREDGAVTVDWLVLTAAIVALGVVVGPSISVGTIAVAELISDRVGSITVGPPPSGDTPGGSVSDGGEQQQTPDPEATGG